MTNRPTPHPVDPRSPRPKPPTPRPTPKPGKSWRRELAHQFQAAAATALVVAGLELMSVYFSMGVAQ